MLAALRRTSRLAAGLPPAPLSVQRPDPVLLAGEAALARLPATLEQVGRGGRGEQGRAPAARAVAPGVPWRLAA
jgi:hypothetical protein